MSLVQYEPVEEGSNPGEEGPADNIHHRGEDRNYSRRQLVLNAKTG